MFAFAIWDSQDRRAVLRRDPFGIKPLYYTLAEGGRQLRFASERKALLGPGEVSVIDPDALRRYLSFQYVPAPATMTPPVRCLPRGLLPDRAAGRAARPAVTVLAADAAVGQVARPGHPGARARRAARLGRRPPAQRRAGRRVPVGRRGLGGDLRDRRARPSPAC